MVFRTGLKNLSLPIGDRDHKRGSDRASVTLLEYGDYQCPHCRRAFSIVEEIQKKLGDRLLLVYRHFPLTEMHQYAESAAEAAEAAGLQGKFWEMHRLLYTGEGLENDKLKKYAAGIGLDTNRFNRDMETHSQSARVREDLQSGISSGVFGTPSFFINGEIYYGSWAPDEFLAVIKGRMK